MELAHKRSFFLLVNHITGYIILEPYLLFFLNENQYNTKNMLISMIYYFILKMGAITFNLQHFELCKST